MSLKTTKLKLVEGEVMGMDEKIIQLQTKTLSLIYNALDKVDEMSCMTFRDVDELKNLTDEIKTYSLLLKELSKLKKAASLKETA